MFKLDTALATWRHQYKYSRSFKGRDLDELEQHLRDQVAYLVSSGSTEEEAFRSAVAELGAYHETETDYRAVAWMKTRDRREITKEIAFSITMLLNYFRVAFRNLKKNKISSAINILGLSVSIAVVLVTYLFVDSVMNQDVLHENADEIFLVHQVKEGEDGVMWWGNTPTPLATELKDNSPLVERVARVAQASASVAYGDSEMRASVRFVDPEFLEMFTFALSSGATSALENPDQVLISGSMAERFFGTSDPIGQVLRTRIGSGEPVELLVTGVAEDFVASANIQFTMLMSYNARSLAAEVSENDWTIQTLATFVQLRTATSELEVERHLNTYVDRVNAADPEWQILGFELDNLKNLAHNRENVSRSISGGVSMAPVVVLSLISVLLLLLSCFNYMNVTIATASRRLKEIGVRKAVGGSRKQLVFQFLAENMQLCTISLLIGLWLAWQFILPAFSVITGVVFEFGLFDNVRLWFFLGALILVTGLASGAYPALYVSGFRPTVIFQGRQSLGGRRPLTHAFLTFQFMLAFLTMSSGIVLTMNGQYHANRDWGYEGEHVLVFQTEVPAELNLIHGTALQTPGVETISLSRDALGYRRHEVDVVIGGEEIEVVQFGTSKSYARLMGIQLKEGVFLDDSLSAIGAESVVINETFATEAGWDDPVGRFFEADSTTYSVAGVLADFHYADFFSVIKPTFFSLVPESEYQYATLTVQPGSGMATADFINTALKTQNPDPKARHFFHDEKFQEFYEESNGIAAIFVFVATLALMISCLSIFALSSQNVVNRLKEIGVRKVLGGSSAGIAQLVNKKLLIILTIGAALSAPLAYMGLDALLDDIFAYRMPLTPVPFILTYLLILGTTLLTISSQVRSINRARPADIMRAE